MRNEMPKNLQAERAVIGACLMSSDALGKVTEMLKPEDFYDVSNRMSYEICLSLYNSERAVDLVTFESEAKKRGEYDRVGGQPYLAEVVSDTVAVVHAVYYAEIVKDAALHRRVIEAGNKISGLGYKTELGGGELMEEVERIMLEASTEKEKSGLVSIEKTMPSVFAEIEELMSGRKKNAGYMTKLIDMDRILGGFQPGSLNIIAARPSMGKTALALNIAQFGSNTEETGNILFFSLEMSSKQLIHRMLSSQTLELGEGVEVSAIASGTLSGDDVYALERACEALQRRKIHINDSSALSAMELRTKSRLFKMRNPDLSLIVVDYLQLMSSGSRRNENRQYEVAEISRMLKSTAVELNCPILALSQLSRETERRTEKKPQLSDLRDSGAIEQDADTVILLFREDYYGENENNDALDSRADIRVAKNRNGETGMCHLLFRRNYTRFMNYGGNM